MSEGDNNQNSNNQNSNQNNGEGQNGSNNASRNDGQNNSGNSNAGGNANDQNNSGSNANGDSNGNTGLSQEQYEKRIAELDKRDKALDTKLERMEKLNEKITAEGSPTGGQAQQPTAGEKQKAKLMGNFGGCIDGLDKML